MLSSRLDMPGMVVVKFSVSSQGEARLQVKKIMGCGVEIPELQFVEPQKIGLGLGFLKNLIQDERIQSKEEGSNGFSRVIWEISV